MLNQTHCKTAKLIVCVLARGQSSTVLEALEESEAEHVLASEYVSIRHQSGNMGWEEMDLLRVAVVPKYAESVFDRLYREAETEICEGAYMYQVDVPWITHFELPDIPKGGVPISSLHSEVVSEQVDSKVLKALKTLCDKK